MSVLQVQVFGLYTREGFHENFDCPIKVSLYKAGISLPHCLTSVVISFVVLKVVALHPQFTRSNYKQFVTGGKKVSVCPAFYLHAEYSVYSFRLPAKIIHPDCVLVKPNPAHLPSLLGSRQGTGLWRERLLLFCLFAGVLSGELAIFTKCCSFNNV